MVKVINQSTGQIREVSESVASSGALELSGWVRHNTPRTPPEIAEKFNEIIDDIENEDEENEAQDFSLESLEDKSLPELKKYAKENGISFKGNPSKKVLINLINSHGN